MNISKPYNHYLSVCSNTNILQYLGNWFFLYFYNTTITTWSFQQHSYAWHPSFYSFVIKNIGYRLLYAQPHQCVLLVRVLKVVCCYNFFYENIILYQINYFSLFLDKHITLTLWSNLFDYLAITWWIRNEVTLNIIFSVDGPFICHT